MIGKTIAHYKIFEKLGGGGMGVIYKAEDTKLRRTVALKFLPLELTQNEEAKKRFIREAQSISKLQHNNICTIHEINETDDGLMFICMDCYEGEILKDRISQGPLSLNDAIDIAIQVAEGLAEAHSQKILHRDVKPANIIVTRKGVVKILDFGLAKLAGRTRITKTGRRVGTIAYMSPEQAQGLALDHRTDIWSLGIVLYEMVAGRLPFEGDHDPAVVYQIVNKDAAPLSSFRSDIPEAVTRIIEKAMEKNPDDRFQHLSSMIAELKLVREELLSRAAAEGHSEPSIAVLPFTNMSADKEQDYFCDGMAEDIINSLSQIERLRVVARTSSFVFRNTNLDIREIGGKLGVDTVLEGSVRKAGNRLRITAQLVNVADGYQLWSGRYDRDLQDVFAIQDEIGQNIVQALQVTLTEKEKRALQKVPTMDIGAYDFYIRGRQYYHGLGVKGLQYARNMFTSAIIMDPQYALAYCSLADCYSMIYTYYDSNRTNIENALTASQKALELDSELAEAHASHGLAVSLDGRYEEAEKEFERAIEISPKLFEAYYFYARTCRAQGKLEKAAKLFSEASAVQPDDYQAPILLADTYRGLDQPEEKLKAFRRGLAVAEKHLEFHPEDARARYLGAHAHYELGAKEKAIEWNERAMKLAPNDPATLYNAACLFCVMGEYGKCFDCLEKAVENGFAYREWAENDPDLEPVRNDPRYRALLKKLR